MNTYTIAQAKEMVGQVIPRIEGKLTKVFDRKTGEGQYGPYSFQNGELEDATGTMKVSFGNHTDVSSMKGQTIVLKSQSSKHGLKGVEVKANEYQGKTTIELKISKMAMVLGDGAEDPRDDAPKAPAAPRALKPAPTGDEVRLGMAMTRNRLTQLGGLYELCYATAATMEKIPDAMTMETVKDIASCLFIQMVREGFADGMPVRSEKTENTKEENQNEPTDNEPTKEEF